MSIVVDTSAVLAWVYADESSSSTQRILDLASRSGAWVPTLWLLEVVNVLKVGVRRNRHDAAFRDETLADLAQLPIRIDPTKNFRAWGATLQLAVKHRLTMYDASYFELAIRRSLPLATLDRELWHAAQAEAVPTLQ